MKLFNRFKELNIQTRWMIAVIILLLFMIVTRWGYISQTAGNAIQQRFAPSTEQTASTERTITE